jgi:3-oxoadipate enol-lactonase
LKSLTVLGTPVVTASAVDSGYSSREIDEHGVGHWARRTMRNRLGTSMPAEAQAWWARMMERTPASTQAGFMDFLPGIDVRPVLPRIACPTLVVTTGDPSNPAQNITGLEATRAWQETIPHSELLVIPDDSFHVAATAPDTAARATLAFIDRMEDLPPGSRPHLPAGTPTTPFEKATHHV